MLYYPWNKAEMKKVENAIGRNQNYWKQQGVSKVTGKLVSSEQLTWKRNLETRINLETQFLTVNDVLTFNHRNQLGNIGSNLEI